MTFRSVLLFLFFPVTACHESPVAPASPPEGVPVTQRILNSPDAIYSGNPVIVAQGDSVMLTAELPFPNCATVRLSAGMTNGRLIVTRTSRPLGEMVVCTLEFRTAVYRFVVRPAPSGRYTAVLRERFESPTEGPQEREIVRGQVVVP